MKFTILTCGGTIDKDYGVWKWIYDVEPANPVAGEIFNKNKVKHSFEVIEIMRKDSLDMTDEDRKKVYNAIKNLSDDKIIVTHWTDTLIDTAKAISDLWKNKLVILVWASRPYRMKETDAEFNLWVALGVLNAFSQLGQKGVYIVMNGEIFTPDNVQKLSDGTFSEI